MRLKSIFLICFIALSGFIFSGCTIGKQANSANPTPDATLPKTDIILYYGEGCPHCAKVEDYLNKNNVRGKLNFETKEVYSNKDNAQEMAQKANLCGINQNNIGVPFLWDGKNCYVGDSDIIKFFEEKMK